MIDRDEACQLATAIASCSPRLESDKVVRIDLRGVLAVLSSHSERVSFSLDAAPDGAFRLRTSFKGPAFPESQSVSEQERMEPPRPRGAPEPDRADAPKPKAAAESTSTESLKPKGKPVAERPLPPGLVRPPLPPVNGGDS